MSGGRRPGSAGRAGWWVVRWAAVVALAVLPVGAAAAAADSAGTGRAGAGVIEPAAATTLSTRLSGSTDVSEAPTSPLAALAITAGATSAVNAFQQVSAGGYHTCGLKADGSIVCWGSNVYSQYSQGKFGPAPPGPYSQVSAGDGHACGLKTDGSVVCWGAIGQHGPVPAGSYRQVSAGNRYTCGLKTDGSVVCWGEDFYGSGQLGPVPPSRLARSVRGSSTPAG